MIFVLILALLVAWYLFNTVVTWAVQWALTEITGEPMPFWPVFVLVALAIFLFNLAASKEVKL